MMAPQLLLNFSRSNALATGWFRIMSVNSRAFRAVILANRHLETNAMTNLTGCSFYLATAGSSFLTMVWPLKVRVNENSPSLCPTMSSVTNTRLNSLPL